MRLPHARFPELGEGLVQVQREFLGQPVEEEFEKFLAKLKLLLEERLVQSLVSLRLLAEVKEDLSLLGLRFLFGQRGIEFLGGLRLLVALMGSFLVKIRSLLEQKMVQSLVNLYAEERRSLQAGSPMFLLPVSDKE
jgi:hypothetical protein